MHEQSEMRPTLESTMMRNSKTNGIGVLYVSEDRFAKLRWGDGSKEVPEYLSPY